jgi:hypothetical protein
MQEIVVDTQNYLNDNYYIRKGGHHRHTPWKESLYRLISWLDMEQFTFEGFYNIRLALGQMKRDYALPKQQGLNTLAPEEREIEGYEVKYLSGYMEFIKGQCEQIGLSDSATIIGEFISELDDKKIEGIKASRVSARIDEIDRAIIRGMNSHLFLHVTYDKAEYYQPWGEGKRAELKQEIPLFGNTVYNNFPSARYDIEGAGNCFAFDCYTACVFHLMRVLQVGLSVVAKKFNVPSDHTNWHNIIEQIESKIKDMGNDPARPINWKSEQEFYAQVASHFMFLKDAWRNSVTHGRRNYSEHEAKRIMENVQGFMQKLATKLSE